ncbi:DUF2252 domain-containing protein [Edaphobacter sp. HDX4]|uniref:DUF2252 domain-containing protein n=1 Tax=Edaphobacter sp. HDX4 TaxID=2794064 RepID=UPI002FE65015
MATPKKALAKTSSPRNSKPAYAKRTAKATAPEPLIAFHGDRPLAERRDAGKAFRNKVPREAHGKWARRSDFPGVVEIVMAGNKGRLEKYVPLRLARMAASPFAFYRGAAAVMAQDLAPTPVTGLMALIDGDAHINNFGLYGTPQRDVIFDLNDFDESVIGPWEWDLKRLVASVNLAGRENGLNRRERAEAVRRCVLGYRTNLNRLQTMGVLETWYLHAYPGRANPLVKIDPKSRAVWTKAVAKAAHQTNLSLLAKVAEKVGGRWRFREDPPVLTHVDNATRNAVEKALFDYAGTLHRERKFMLSRYRIADVAHRIVGVGSVGNRAYLALLFGNGDNDPLFLQVKEAIVPALYPFVEHNGRGEFSHQGMRIVIGQRGLQASTDVMLGWTEIDGRPFFVRQMKNMKGSIPVEWLTGDAFNFYVWVCGALLARAHARTTDIARVAGYCGSSAVLDDALAIFAESYGDQTILDHAALVQAVKDDPAVQAMMGK